VLQLPELQLEQALPELLVPAMRVSAPALLLKQAKVDIWRRAGRRHLGQGASLSAWLNGRNISNLVSHSEQKYSYIGITPLLFIV
jgi:hypothetical protein